MVSQRIVGLSETLSRVDSDARKALETTLAEANAYTEQLAQINAKIKEGTAAEASIGPAPEYLDERDRLLMRLQKLVGGQTVINTDQTATHYMNGIPLVEGDLAHRFNVLDTAEEIDNLRITFTSLTYSSGGNRVNINNESRPSVATEMFVGGAAGAYVKLIRDFLPDVNRRLDAVAIGLLKTTNEISPNPIFGFRVDTGNLVSNTTIDEYVKEIPTVSSASGIYEIRDRLNPTDPEYSEALWSLRAGSFVAVAPQNTDDWQITGDQAFALEAKRSTFADPVADIVATVGSQIATWSNNRAADKSVMEILNTRREEISGVNLDEEAANMVKFQQLYAASSKIIQTGNEMFQTLLSMVSR
jgi:flagellar hook-associated protein 1 FlgK